MAFNDDSYAVIQGEIFVAKRAMNGAQTGGYLSIGDADKFEISPKQKHEDIKESQTGLGLTSAHVPIETDVSVEMNMKSIKFKNLEMALWGSHGGSVDSGTVSDEALKLYPGAYCPLQHPGVSSVTLSAGVVDVDYTVDTINGGIQVIAGSLVFTDEDGTDVTADYSFAAYGGRVQAFAVQQPVFMIRVNGKNIANPGSTNYEPIIANVFQWTPDMTKMLSLIGKKSIDLSLDGMLLQDKTKPLPTPSSPMSQFFEIIKG